uniref:Dolichol-phosphate mannosyltransferase subunit 3 n=2 Tax=Oryza TaxID=4527 RepID=A0A0D3FAI2_9ORYZ
MVVVLVYRATVSCQGSKKFIVLPIYLVVALGCYGLFMVGFGLMFFPTCPQEAVLLQQDILEAKEFLSKKGVDVGSE